MKNLTAVKIVLAGALAAGIMIAQGPGFGRSGGAHQGTPQWRLDRLTVMLQLSDAQKQQAQVIFDAAAEAAQALEPALEQARTALHEAARANRPAAEIDKYAAALGAALGQAHAIHAKALTQFYQILTAAQREQFDKYAGAGLCPMGPGGGGGMMGGLGAGRRP